MADAEVVIQIKGDSREYDAVIKGLGQTTQNSLSTAVKGSFIGNLFANAFSKAAGTISSAMDGAISRVDTLNQFPKVMANIGFSADDAKASISKMSDGIEGLPTSLDDIVGNTQQLALSLGDLDQATDVALALNDGFITFGASSSDVTNAITQLNQMITAGKYDMQSWNSINQSAPGYLDAIAKSMLGMDANASQLRDALNDGTVSSEDFMAAIVRMDKEGGAGFEAFSTAARDASGGIETSMTNVDTAVKKNLANIIQALNSNGEISGGFDAIKQGINDAGTAIVNGIGLIKDNFDTIGPAIGGVVGAMATFKGAMLISSLVSTVTGAINTWKTANDGLRVSQILLNAVIGANPVMVVITIIGALIGVLITAYTTNEDFRNAVNSAWQTITETVGGAIESVVSFFTDFANNAQMGAQAFYDNVIQPISQVPEQIGNFFTQIGENVVNFFTEFATNAQMGAQSFFDNVITPIGQVPEQIATFLSQVITDLMMWVVNLALQAVQAGSGFLDGIISFFTQLPGNIANFLTTVRVTVTLFVANLIANAIQGGSQFLSNIVNFFSQLPGNVWNFLSNAISRIVSFVADIASQAIQGGSQFLSNIGNFFAQLPGNVANFLSNAISNIISFAANIASQAISAGNGFLSGISSGFSSAVSFISGIPGEILGFFAGIGGWLIDSGASLIDGFVQGIKNAFSNAISAVQEGLSNIRSFFPFSPAKKGPFSGHGYTSYSGLALMRDFAGGIKGGTKGAVSTAKAALGAISDTLNSGSLDTSLSMAGASLNSVTSVDILGQAFMDGVEAITSRLDAINSRLANIENKLDRDTSITINGREFGRIVRDYL